MTTLASPQRPRAGSGTTVKQNRIVAILATVFLGLLVLFYIPAIIFHKNSFFLDGAFHEYVVLSLGVLSILSLAAFLVFFKLPARVARTVAPVVSFVAIGGFVMSAFITPSTVDIGPLDGTQQAIQINYFLASLEIVLCLVLVGALWFFYDRFAAAIRDLLVLLSILVVAYTGYVTLRDVRKRAAPTASVHEFMRFSENENVLLILLDTLASDYLLAMLEENPELTRELDGFTFFRDVASVAPTTYMAMPSIHSGQYLAPDRPFRQAYDEQIGRRSFLSEAARGGASVHLLNKTFVCPDEVNCLSSAEVLAVSQEAVVQDWNLLIDIALFRVVPHALKPLVYNDGEWYFSRFRKSENPLGVNSYRDNRVMHEFARQLHVDGAQPQVKFVHLINTHYPFNVGRDCEVVPVDNNSLDLALNAARCAMEGLVAIFDSLKKNGIYESALIVVFADHGAHLEYVGSANAHQIDVDESLRFQLREASRDRSRTFPKSPNKAHPVFLIKRPGETGLLRFDTEHAVSLTDLPATVCAYSPLCVAERGVSAFDAPEASSRERMFNDYTWRPEMWGADNLEDELEKIVIDYSVLDRGAFDTVTGDAFLFNQPSFRFKGFGRAEEWGRWSDGFESELKLCFAVPPASPLEWVMKSRVFLSDRAPRQRVVVRIGGDIVTEQTFEYSEAGGKEYELRARLEPHQVDESGCALITFEFPDAVPAGKKSPANKRLVAFGPILLRFE